MNPRPLIPALSVAAAATIAAACAAPNPIAYQRAELDLFYTSDAAAAAHAPPTANAQPTATVRTTPGYPGMPTPGAVKRPTLPNAPSLNAPDPEGDFSLALVMDLARTHAIQVLRAADAHLAATADLRVATAETYYPTFSVGAGTGRTRGIVQGTDGTFLRDINKESVRVGMSVGFDIDLAAATHGLRAARLNIRASTWDWIAAEQAAETAAAILYHDLLEARARVEIAETAVDRASAYHALAEARFQAGAGLESDVLRAFAHLAESRQQHVEALAVRGTASTHIAELLGLDPLRPLDPTDALAPIDLVADINEVDLNTHPLLKAAASRLSAAQAAAQAQRSTWLLPNLHLDAGFSDFGEEFGDVDDQETLTAAISWDLSPSQFARVDRAQVDLLRAQHEAEATRRRVESNLVRTQIAALAADDLLATTEARATAARAAVGLERTRHEEGDALLIELLDAELSLRRAETAQAAAICTHNRAQHLLHQALGE